MTIYDIWLYILQSFLGTMKFFKDHPTVPGLIILILRQNGIRKVINKQLPRGMRDTVDADILEIKEDVKLIKKHLGVIGEWQSNGQQNGLKRHPLSFSKLFAYLRKAIKLAYLQRRMKTMEKLKSRKLWMAIFGALLPIINEQFNLGLNAETVIASIGAIVAYVLGQAHVDAKKVVTDDAIPAINTESNK